MTRQQAAAWAGLLCQGCGAGSREWPSPWGWPQRAEPAAGVGLCWRTQTRRVTSRVLQQHQGRNQQPWDGLKRGPGQSAGAVKLSGAPRALTAACYLMFASSLCCRSPGMQYIVHIIYRYDMKLCFHICSDFIFVVGTWHTEHNFHMTFCSHILLIFIFNIFPSLATLVIEWESIWW